MKRYLKDLKQLRWQNFIILFVAGCINAFGVTAFLAPVKLYDSGISGTSILLSQITPCHARYAQSGVRPRRLAATLGGFRPERCRQHIGCA